MTKPLKPCPFCGEHAHLFLTLLEEDENFSYVDCGRCGANSGLGKTNELEAGDKWNRRADGCSNVSEFPTSPILDSKKIELRDAFYKSVDEAGKPHHWRDISPDEIWSEAWDAAMSCLAQIYLEQDKPHDR